MAEVQERRKKTVEASMTEQVHLIMQQHLNGGGRLFGGALMQWLDEMEQHSDVAVRGGVKLTREYVQHLQEEIRRLEEENQLKAQYLKKMKEKNCKYGIIEKP